LEKNLTLVLVVAAALVGPAGHVLMQRRRLGGPYGGLWEFPGGKVEPGESPESALIRELLEELGIAVDVAALVPLCFSSDRVLPPAPRMPHVILLYTCRRWHGSPRCLDAEEIAWFSAGELAGLPMPPLDIPLVHALVGKLASEL